MCHIHVGVIGNFDTQTCIWIFDKGTKNAISAYHNLYVSVKLLGGGGGDPAKITTQCFPDLAKKKKN